MKYGILALTAALAACGGARTPSTTAPAPDPATPGIRRLVDSLFSDFDRTRGATATVLVAAGGTVMIDAAYGSTPGNARATTAQNFPLLGLSAGFNAAAVIGIQHDGKLSYDDVFPDGSGRTIQNVLIQYEQSAANKRTLVRLITSRGGAPYAAQIAQRIFTPLGMQTAVVDSVSGEFQANVRDLYRWERGMTDVSGLREGPFGWRIERYKGLPRESEYGTSDGKRNAFVRFPSKKAAIIILTNRPTADTQAMAERIADRLLFSGTR